METAVVLPVSHTVNPPHMVLDVGMSDSEGNGEEEILSLHFVQQNRLIDHSASLKRPPLSFSYISGAKVIYLYMLCVCVCVCSIHSILQVHYQRLDELS